MRVHFSGVSPSPIPLGQDIWVQRPKVDTGGNITIPLRFWHKSCQPDGDDWGEVTVWWDSVASHAGFHCDYDNLPGCVGCEWKPSLAQWMIMNGIYTAIRVPLESVDKS